MATESAFRSSKSVPLSAFLHWLSVLFLCQIEPSTAKADAQNMFQRLDVLEELRPTLLVHDPNPLLSGKDQLARQHRLALPLEKGDSLGPAERLKIHQYAIGRTCHLVYLTGWANKKANYIDSEKYFIVESPRNSPNSEAAYT